jgi:hypothetical protein
VAAASSSDDDEEGDTDVGPLLLRDRDMDTTGGPPLLVVDDRCDVIRGIEFDSAPDTAVAAGLPRSHAVVTSTASSGVGCLLLRLTPAELARDNAACLGEDPALADWLAGGGLDRKLTDAMIGEEAGVVRALPPDQTGINEGLLLALLLVSDTLATTVDEPARA